MYIKKLSVRKLKLKLWGIRKLEWFSAVRSGDYYMFDDIDDEELDLIKEDEDESSSEMDDLDGKKRFTMSKVSFFNWDFNFFYEAKSHLVNLSIDTVTDKQFSDIQLKQFFPNINILKCKCIFEDLYCQLLIF